MRRPFHITMSEEELEGLRALAELDGLSLAQAARLAFRRERERRASEAASVGGLMPGRSMAT